jgi:perosamine synthetase
VRSIYINNFLVQCDWPLRRALQIISKNGRGVCFVLKKGKLVGSLSDGDARRALLRGETLEQKISKVMNNSVVFLPVKSTESSIRRCFNKDLKIIPLVNEKNRVVDIADVLKSHRIPVLEPYLSKKEAGYVQDCMNSNWISSQGKYIQKFEEMFEKYHPGTHAVAVANGTVALHLALTALGVGKGDEVIVPAVTFVATINAVLYCNATPVICEIDAKTWCIDPKNIASLINSKTKAIIPVHLYGQSCDMHKICRIANQKNIKIVEDTAEALGSCLEKKPLGTFGDSSTFSFFGNKTISTGEGGMVLFKNSKLAKKAKILRDHGMNPNRKYWHDIVGFNYRMTNLQASIGVAQMERLNKILVKKREIAEFYKKSLKNVPGIRLFPFESKKIKHSHWLYTVVLSNKIARDQVISELLECGIDTRPVFYPLHFMPPYEKHLRSNSLKVSENISLQGLSLPSSASLGKEELDFIVSNLKRVLTKQNKK